MTLNVNEASILNKKNIKFTSAPQQEVKEQKTEEPKEKKSFYESNKKALIALSAIGIATIALGTHHYIKSRNITDAEKSATDKITKKGQKALNKFKEKLNKFYSFSAIHHRKKSLLSKFFLSLAQQKNNVS